MHFPTTAAELSRSAETVHPQSPSYFCVGPWQENVATPELEDSSKVRHPVKERWILTRMLGSKSVFSYAPWFSVSFLKLQTFKTVSWNKAYACLSKSCIGHRACSGRDGRAVEQRMGSSLLHRCSSPALWSHKVPWERGGVRVLGSSPVYPGLGSPHSRMPFQPQEGGVLQWACAQGWGSKAGNWPWWKRRKGYFLRARPSHPFTGRPVLLHFNVQRRQRKLALFNTLPAEVVKAWTVRPGLESLLHTQSDAGPWEILNISLLYL